MPTTRIEQQLTILFRRVQRIHLSTAHGDISLERSAYGIMCLLADGGSQRLSALAATFGLDPSTITRQVQALEAEGLVVRASDPTDRRASLLSLTESGATALATTRTFRQEAFADALSDWSNEQKEQFAHLLAQFNAAMATLESTD